VAGHPLANALALALLILASLRLRPLRARARMPSAIPWVSWAVLAGYAAVIVHYVLSPQFMDQLEAMVASMSWALTQGKPLYHQLEASGRHSVLYGPYLYIFTLPSLKTLGPSLHTVKIGAAVASISSLALLFAAMRRYLPSRRARLLLIALLALAYLGVPGASFWIRSEPWMLALVGLGLLSAIELSPWRASLYWGLTAGMLAGLKLHGVIYALPALAILSLRAGWLSILAGVLVSMATFALPFVAAPQLFDFERMLLWVRITSQHGTSLEHALGVLEWGLFYAAILLPWLLGYRVARKDRQELPLYLGALALVLLLACGSGSLKGAGRHHLVPWLPSLALGGAMLLRYPGRGRWHPFAVALSAACALSLLAIGARRATEGWLQLDRMPGERIVAELEAIRRSYPTQTIEMGYGANYDLSLYRPVLVFAQARFLLDGSALMDMAPYGLAVTEGTYQRIRACDPPLWLFPKGEEPLGLRHLAPPHPQIFPEDFRRVFLERFRPKESREFYSVWECYLD
jgi:hypothetical protein